ncbi:hypothetical protein ETD83_09760 [Actinomadura soli]|uniref:Uncharacterized protein n=1 Tax=Actinomadura soli TaxID=2508997 RepID=A0A5C4JFS5_9ACTN|nr:hypothetical protein [Actinomadura soli]TMR03783.1 hypothetical protein ETD83_09760 [Actinomadura soli]
MSAWLGPPIKRAMPHTMRNIPAPEGAVISVVITGFGSWACVRGNERWELRRSEPGPAIGGTPDVLIGLDPDTAWRLCTRGITPARAIERARIEGDRALGEAALQIVSIIHPGDDAPDQRM